MSMDTRQPRQISTELTIQETDIQKLEEITGCTITTENDLNNAIFKIIDEPFTTKYIVVTSNNSAQNLTLYVNFETALFEMCRKFIKWIDENTYVKFVRKHRFKGVRDFTICIKSVKIKE